jgi:hypothetical protein
VSQRSFVVTREVSTIVRVEIIGPESEKRTAVVLFLAGINRRMNGQKNVTQKNVKRKNESPIFLRSILLPY